MTKLDHYYDDARHLVGWAMREGYLVKFRNLKYNRRDLTYLENIIVSKGRGTIEVLLGEAVIATASIFPPSPMSSHSVQKCEPSVFMDEWQEAWDEFKNEVLTAKVEEDGVLKEAAHASDCAILHNKPAYPIQWCDCHLSEKPGEDLSTLLGHIEKFIAGCDTLSVGKHNYALTGAAAAGEAARRWVKKAQENL